MMNRIALIVTAACLLAIGNQAIAQKKAERYSVTEREKGISENADGVNYGIVSPDEIKKDMKCVLEYLERNTPYEVIDGKKEGMFRLVRNLTEKHSLNGGLSAWWIMGVE